VSDAPFFVVGSPRSGTTLVRRLLCAHPRLYIPGETGFVPFLRVDPAAPLSADAAAAVLRRIGALNRHWAHDPEELGPWPADGSLGELLGRLYGLRAARYGARRWGDKTPGYVRYLAVIARIFPDCRIVHILRDGRDVALSARALWGAEHWYMDLHYLLRQWAINVRSGRRDGALLGPRRYLEISYEELVTAPHEVMTRVLAFLGEEPHRAIDEAIESGEPVPGSRFHDGVHRPVSGASVARWRRELTRREARLADALVGDLLAELGYAPADLGPPTPAERLANLPGTLRYGVAGPLRRALYAAGLLTLNRGLRARRRLIP
jgi:hypothetical protein